MAIRVELLFSDADAFWRGVQGVTSVTDAGDWLLQKLEMAVPLPVGTMRARDVLTKEAIEAAVREHGSYSKAARSLGVARKTLAEKAARYGIAPGQRRNPTRFEKLTRKLAERGARTPKALAAWIGRRKYGKAAFQKMAVAGKRRAKERAR